jgi:hypothetical protein
MTHYFIELLAWVLLAYVAGCFAGWLLKNLVPESGGEKPKAGV